MNVNPADSEIIAVFPEVSKDDLEAAFDAARFAFRQWCEVPAPERGRTIFRAAEILEASKEELAWLITIYEDKTLNEGFAEVRRTIDILRFLGGEGWRFCGETIPSEAANSWILTVHEPLGVVGVITPWNFLLAIPAWKFCPALVAGNTVVFKPSSLTPLTAMKLVSILSETSLPKGVLNFVTGKGATVGQGLVESQNIDTLTLFRKRWYLTVVIKGNHLQTPFQKLRKKRAEKLKLGMISCKNINWHLIDAWPSRSTAALGLGKVMGLKG